MKTSSCHIDEVLIRPTDYALVVSQSEKAEPFALIIDKDAALNPDIIRGSQGKNVRLQIDGPEVKQISINDLPVFDPHAGKPVRLGVVRGVRPRTMTAVAVPALG